MPALVVLFNANYTFFEEITETYKHETDVRLPMFGHTYPDIRLKSRKSIRTVERLEPDLAAASCLNK